MRNKTLLVKKEQSKSWKKHLILLGMCAVLGLSGCCDKEVKETYKQAAEYLEAKDYEAAAEAYQQVADAEMKLPEAYRGLGIAQLNLGRYAEASIALSKSLYYMEDDNEAFEKDVKSYLAISRTRRMEYEEAIKLYTELIQMDGSEEYYYLRGKCYIAMENYEEAKKDFDIAASMSTDYNLFLNIYEVYNNLQMNADASAYLEQALSLVSEKDHYSRGLIHYYLQDYTKAKEALIQSINNEENAKAMLLLGKVYLSLDDATNARTMYMEYTDNPELAAEAYNGLALCDIAESNYQSALENIQKGLECEGDEVRQSLLFNEICVYEYLKNWDMAREKANQYVQLYPTDEAGQREKAFLMH